MYLLDTNVCITLIRRRTASAERILTQLTQQAVTNVAVSALTVAELEYGVARSREPSSNRSRLDQFLLPLQVLPFDDAAAAAYGPVRAELEARGRGIGAIDALLAAQAISLDAAIVTNNVKEFSRISQLVLEDWS